jgi:hypothetical protein
MSKLGLIASAYHVAGGGGGTTPTITAGTNGSTGTSAGSSTSAASFTPVANAKIYGFIVAENDNVNSTARSWSVTGGGFTWNKIAEPVVRSWAGDPNYGTNCALFEISGTTGGSPSAFAAAIDPGTNTYYMSWSFFSVSGGTITHVQSVTSISEQETAGSSETLTLTLGGAATSGSLCVACFAAADDTTSSFATPSTWTALVNQSQTSTKVAVFYKTTHTSATVQCTDMGQQVGVSCGAIMELIA